jgi:endonuclease/exonuclease/phosphatase family metal-dependent hydrolase
MNIRLATYNIHKFVGTDGRRSEPRILQIISAMNADILALQEFVLNDQSGNISSVEAFAAKSGYDFIAQPMLRSNGMVQFNLLLSRIPVRTKNLVTLPRDGKEPRGVIDAQFEIEGHRFRVAATHLGLTPGARMRQLARIFELHAGRDDEPFALLGDLNIMFPWEPARRRLQAAFSGQKQPRAFPSRWPMLAVDSIYFRRVQTNQSVRTFTDGAARRASDHLPLVADIGFSRPRDHK